MTGGHFEGSPGALEKSPPGIFLGLLEIPQKRQPVVFLGLLGNPQKWQPVLFLGLMGNPHFGGLHGSTLGVCTASFYRETFKGWGASPPILSNGFPVGGGR